MTVLVGQTRADPAQFAFDIDPCLRPPLETYHPAKLLSLSVRLRRKIATIDPDFVHSFITYPYLPAAAVATLGQDVALSANALGTYAVEPFSSLKTRHLHMFGYSRADKILSISQYTDDRIREHVSLRSSTVIPLGVNIEEFGDGRTPDGNYVLCVGAVKPRKGQDLLLQAFAEIAPAFPDISLRFAGPVHDESFKSELDEIIRDYGLEERVEFHGIVDDERLKQLYTDSIFFSLTPRVVNDNFEGSGLVYLEAATYGKPAVGTRSGGVPTSIVHQGTGLLAPEGDIEEIAGALQELLSDNDLREQYGQNARERVESMSWDWYTREITSEFESIVDR